MVDKKILSVFTFVPALSFPVGAGAQGAECRPVEESDPGQTLFAHFAEGKKL